MVLCTVVYEGWCQLRSVVILVFVSCLGKRCPSVSACTVMAISHVVVIIFMWLQNTNNKWSVKQTQKKTVKIDQKSGVDKLFGSRRRKLSKLRGIPGFYKL